MIVFLITSGSGADGDEWYIKEACATRAIAERRLIELKASAPSWQDFNEIEELEVTEK